ncbi:hypothetical protein AB0I00_21150 [Streptomyces sp. NPDC050803]
MDTPWRDIAAGSGALGVGLIVAGMAVVALLEGREADEVGNT